MPLLVILLLDAVLDADGVRIAGLDELARVDVCALKATALHACWLLASPAVNFQGELPERLTFTFSGRVVRSVLLALSLCEATLIVLPSDHLVWVAVVSPVSVRHVDVTALWVLDEHFPCVLQGRHVA